VSVWPVNSQKKLPSLLRSRRQELPSICHDPARPWHGFGTAQNSQKPYKHWLGTTSRPQRGGRVWVGPEAPGSYAKRAELRPPWTRFQCINLVFSPSFPSLPSVKRIPVQTTSELRASVPVVKNPSRLHPLLIDPPARAVKRHASSPSTRSNLTVQGGFVAICDLLFAIARRG
jgi:hypothetical protein